MREIADKHLDDPVLVFNKLGRIIGYTDEDELVVKFVDGSINTYNSMSGIIILNTLVGANRTIDSSGVTWDDYDRLDALLTAYNCTI